jgi:hypothetical protein
MLSVEALEFSQALLQLLVYKVSTARRLRVEKNIYIKTGARRDNTLNRQVVNDTSEAVAVALLRTIKDLASSITLLDAPIRESSMVRLWRPWMADSLLVPFPV